MLWFKRGGDLHNRGIRPSPKESATLYKVGYRREGQDGNMYEIVMASNGVKRWQKVKTTSATKPKPKPKPKSEPVNLGQTLKKLFTDALKPTKQVKRKKS